MPDLEKVIKAVECRKNAHKRCGNPCERTGGCIYAKWIRGIDGEPYYPCVCDVERLCDDALTLLREREAEIIRCKDCKHGEIDTAINGVLLSITCDGVKHGPEWFCADGERRDDDA